MSQRLFALAPCMCLLMLAGCASDGGFGAGATGSVAASEPTSIKPECVTLSSRIETLRRDGVTERAAQAASTGKTVTVQVKRTSLSQLAELDKANAEFQAKCSSLPPRAATPVTASAAPAPTAATAPAAKKATAAPVAAAKTAAVAAKPASVGTGAAPRATEPAKAPE